MNNEELDQLHSYIYKTYGYKYIRKLLEVVDNLSGELISDSRVNDIHVLVGILATLNIFNGMIYDHLFKKLNINDGEFLLQRLNESLRKIKNMLISEVENIKKDNVVNFKDLKRSL